MTLEAVDRISVTTVVDNSVDILRADEKVARRWTSARARRFSTLRAEHGLAHWVEVTRGRETARLAFDWGLTGESYTHNLRELGLERVRELERAVLNRRAQAVLHLALGIHEPCLLEVGPDSL